MIKICFCIFQVFVLTSRREEMGRHRYFLQRSTCGVGFSLSSVSVSAQDGIVVLGKAHTHSAPSQQSPQSCPRNSTNICLVEHKSFPIPEGGMSAASLLHSSFLQAISAVMLWPVHVQKVPQASEHLCPAMLQTRCDICCACQSICLFFPTDYGVPRTVDLQKSL